MKNLWLLSEEKPRGGTIVEIIKNFCVDYNFDFEVKDIKINPIIKEDKFAFLYKVQGVRCSEIRNVYVVIASGQSSFVDYLLFFQDEKPDQKSIPQYAIEETKTGDTESRNTGVLQRCTKFVYVDFYYPKINKIMLYKIEIEEKEKLSPTGVFGAKMLATMGVKILGKVLNEEALSPFKTINELIDLKNTMKNPPKGNVPIKIKKRLLSLEISGRLIKNDRLDHDPNIGAMSGICYCLRKLGWCGRIIICSHGLSQKNVGLNNKFIKICNQIKIHISGLRIPKVKLDKEYWNFDSTKEKNVTIFLHTVIESYTNGVSIYENHGGSKRGYFYDENDKPISVPKYREGLKNSYKKGNKKAILSLPDLVILDKDRNVLVVMEGKVFAARSKGISELKNYKHIENEIFKPHYKLKKIQRTVVVFGSTNTSIKESKVGFMLNLNGGLVVNKTAPEIIKEATHNLFASQ